MKQVNEMKNRNLCHEYHFITFRISFSIETHCFPFYELNSKTELTEKLQLASHCAMSILLVQRGRQTNLSIFFFLQLYCEWPVVVSSCNSDSGTLLNVCSSL